MFKVQFLDKYFPKDMCSKKDIKFIELKQGNMTVVEYAAKFGELLKFCSYYNGANCGGIQVH